MAAQSFWQWAQEEPTRLALVTPEGQRLTFGELGARVNAVSHGLLALGLEQGDTVAIQLGNEPAWVEVFMAVHQIGLYLTAINYHLSAEETAYILENSEAKVFIANARYAQQAAGAVERIHCDRQRCFATQGTIEGFRPYEDLLAGQPTAPPEHRQAGSLMLYTSGTTGRPKGVRRALSGRSPEEDAAITQLLGMLFDITPGTGVHLVTGPLYHAAPGTFGMSALHMGQTLVLMDKWTPEDTLRLIQEEGVTVTHMVPTMFNRLLKLPEQERKRYDVSSLRSVIHAAAPCPVDTKKAMLDWWGPVIYEYYGATEGGGTYVKPHEWIKKPGTVGQPWPGSTIKILDDQGKELPPYETGTIYMSSALASFEYFKDKEKTAANRKGDLFTVGDMGYLDEDGWLFISDRKADMIISGGVNIYPAEIEAVLHQHPKVADVAVFGVPDEDWGESVKAVVETVPGVAHSPELAEELRQYVHDRMAHYKVPRSFEFIDQLPRYPTGKLYKRLLRDKYWQGRERKV